MRYLKTSNSLKLSIKAAIITSLFSLVTPSLATEIKSDVDPKSVSEVRATPLGLYLSPKGAFKALKDNPKIVFIDVRDPIEVAFVGHAVGTDKNIPILIASHEFDAERGKYKMNPNPNLLTEVKTLIEHEGLTKKDPIFVACRSGGRSAKVARKLIKAGYTNVWNLVEGFEGDKNKQGVRAVNGWRNANLPWTYKMSKEMAWSSVKAKP